VNAFVFHLSNWDVVRTGAPAKPVFEEVGPYNFSRKVCIFDRQLVPDNKPTAVWFRKHHGPWLVESKPWDGSPGIDVERKLNVLNPAYISVMAKLQRTSPTPISGIEAEVSLHSAIVAGALTAVMQGILNESPDGFLASTFLGAIPTVLQTVVDTLDAKIPDWVPGTDKESPMIAALYLWARPRACGDYGRGVSSCAYLQILDTAFSDGLDLDENGDTKFDGYEVGSQFRRLIEQSTFSGSTARMLWDSTRNDSLRSIDGIVLWNTSYENPTQTVQLQTAFNLKVGEMAMIQNWVQMFSRNVTPPLVTNKLLGLPGPALKGYGNKRYLLAWKQLGEGTISAQRGNRTDGLPKTIHDVNPRVPFEFEFSHWARLNGVALPLTTPWHLEFIFNGSTPEPPYTNQRCSAPLMTPEGVTKLLNAHTMLANPATAPQAAQTCMDTWMVNATQCQHLGTYLKWFFERLIQQTGPVVPATARDILLDRVDQLLSILKTAGRVDSANSGVLFDPSDYTSRAEAAAQPFELYERVWDGSGEGGLGLTDNVPDEYLKAFERGEWATETNTSRAYYVHGEIKDVWEKAVTISGGNGQRFKFGLKKDDVLDVWNDKLARTLSWTYHGDGQLEGIDLWIFTLDEQEFAPDPTYYQSQKGLFNISKLSPADVFVSLPRFAGVDPAQINVEIRPPASELKCCTDWRLFVEPTSGVTMGKHVVTQVNFKSAGYGAFTNLALPAGIMPLMWTEDRVTIPVKDAEKFRDGLATASMARVLFFVLGPLIFVLCCLCMVFLHYRSRRAGGAMEDMDRGYSMH
jgi:hypothetical protein